MFAAFFSGVHDRFNRVFEKIRGDEHWLARRSIGFGPLGAMV
jgi:hypothetical protein